MRYVMSGGFIEGGFSGGPVFLPDGKVVGVLVSAFQSLTQGLIFNTVHFARVCVHSTVQTTNCIIGWFVVTNRTFAPGPTPNTVRAADGTVHAAPGDWILLPPGDAGLTRRVKAAGDHWIVQDKVGRKMFSRGV
jgi:hypothetical protein